MAKFACNEVMDDGLNYIKTNANEMIVCTQEPTSYTEAHTTYNIASVAMTSTDFTVADDTSGRKITTTAKNSVSVTMSGTNNATHIALVNTSASKLIFVTT